MARADGDGDEVAGARDARMRAAFVMGSGHGVSIGRAAAGQPSPEGRAAKDRAGRPSRSA